MGSEWLAALASLSCGCGVWLSSGLDSNSVAHALAGAARRMREIRGAVEGAMPALRDRLGGFLQAPGGKGEVSLGEASEMIDLICLGLSAGLSFDASLSMYCSERDTRLARRMAQAQMSWQVGMQTREEALMDAAMDLELRALESFATAVTQALALGAPLVTTLSAQSAECRAAHRAEVERNIERAPVKILIPTGTLILPALLLSIIGPLLAAGGMV